VSQTPAAAGPIHPGPGHSGPASETEELQQQAQFEAMGGWPAALSALTAKSGLSTSLARATMSEILSGRATAAQIAGFAIGMRTKGEDPAELAVLLDTMLDFGVAVPLRPEVLERALCTCGTGGDRSHSINISTTAAFVVAGAGALVCKHGGRASSSASGSADVLEALGVVLELTPANIAECIDASGVGFCLAPRFHPAMRHAGPVRRELGVATLFNLLGPLANPGRVRRQVVGVSDPAVAERMAQVLLSHGAVHAFVVHGDDGLDEITTTTTSRVIELQHRALREFTVDPRSLGFAPATIEDLRGGSAVENAVHLRSVLAGVPGAHRDIVVLNAAAGLVVSDIASDIEAGCTLAAAAIDSGAAMASLDRLIATSKELAASAL
jgi:anthranilate phosphoribosyltransferase